MRAVRESSVMIKKASATVGSLLTIPTLVTIPTVGQVDVGSASGGNIAMSPEDMPDLSTEVRAQAR
jgi:hypothetical protein